MNTDAEYHILNLLREIKEILKPTPKPVAPVAQSTAMRGPAIGKPAVGKPVTPSATVAAAPHFGSSRVMPSPQSQPPPSPFFKK
jgi:hypothetical protein